MHTMHAHTIHIRMQISMCMVSSNMIHNLMTPTYKVRMSRYTQMHIEIHKHGHDAHGHKHTVMIIMMHKVMIHMIMMHTFITHKVMMQVFITFMMHIFFMNTSAMLHMVIIHVIRVNIVKGYHTYQFNTGIVPVIRIGTTPHDTFIPQHNFAFLV
jgi:hypothetical protein